MEAKKERVEKKAFQRGWFKVPQGEVAGVRIKLMVALGVTTRMAFLNNLNGKTNHTAEQIKDIERIFGEVGIHKKDIWGTI